MIKNFKTGYNKMIINQNSFDFALIKNKFKKS